MKIYDKMSSDYEHLDIIYGLIDKEDYKGIVGFLEKIGTEEKRKELCVVALTIIGVTRCIDEYGEVRVTPNKEKFERAKIGLENCSPYAVLYSEGFDPESKLENIETMLDFVPEDNPLKQYYREIKED